MMHGRGKSDEAIVAVKPANKAERSAAEGGRMDSEGRRPRGMWVSKARAELRAA